MTHGIRTTPGHPCSFPSNMRVPGTKRPQPKRNKNARTRTIHATVLSIAYGHIPRLTVRQYPDVRHQQASRYAST